MRHTTTATLLATLLLGAAVGCGSDHHDPDPAACRTAIKAQYEPGTAKLKGEPERPSECDGLSDDELSKIVTGVIEENTR
jgi:hypothetical protein